MVVDVMILKMALALLSQRLTLWWILWHVVVGSFIYLPSQTRQFSKVQFPAVLDFGFSNSPKVQPKIRPIANLLSSKLLRWKLENPKISQLPKNVPISNPIAKV
jgi:hypothetical protein